MSEKAGHRGPRPETGRRELEASLKRADAEYAQFAYAASHDLLAPLNKIAAFQDLLEHSLEKSLDEQSRDYLARMCRAVGQQRRLIDGLSALARVAAGNAPPEDIDPVPLAREAAADVSGRRAQPDASIAIGTLPPLNADPIQLRLLFQILLDNALKFRRLDAPARVEVEGRELKDGFCEIIVADKGIGFDEKYLDRIFKPFQRLHGAAEYDGAGMGLAIAEKIVSRHQGTITARSTPGAETAFVVRLPGAKSDAVKAGRSRSYSRSA